MAMVMVMVMVIVIVVLMMIVGTQVGCSAKSFTIEMLCKHVMSIVV
jgi:hypothetical protein